MLIICFEKGKQLCGGFGDRIVGLISVRLICKLLNREFAILWNKEDIRAYFDYSKCDFEHNSNRTHHTFATYNYIDNQPGLKDTLMNGSFQHIFPEHTCKIFLNQEISQYLYNNALFAKHKSNYSQDILREYKSLYSDILVPTQHLIDKATECLTQNDTHLNDVPIIGIQVRCGDRYMVTNKKDRRAYDCNNLHKIPKYLSNIKTHIEHTCPNYIVFITSDCDKVYVDACDIFGQQNVVYNSDVIQHLDRNPVTDDISKVFVDNYILSQKTSGLYISAYSNYGRLAALTCAHDNIYDLESCDTILRATILTKGELDIAIN